MGTYKLYTWETVRVCYSSNIVAETFSEAIEIAKEGNDWDYKREEGLDEGLGNNPVYEMKDHDEQGNVIATMCFPVLCECNGERPVEAVAVGIWKHDTTNIACSYCDELTTTPPQKHQYEQK